VQLGNGVVPRYILRGSNQPVHSIDIGTVERDEKGGLKVRSRHGVLLVSREPFGKSASELVYRRPGWRVDRRGHVARGFRAASLACASQH